MTSRRRCTATATLNEAKVGFRARRPLAAWQSLGKSVNPNAISNWLSRLAVQERLETLFAGHAAWASAKFGMRVPEHPGAAYIVLHTLSHALISEIALDCGYPASSLKERVYALAEPGSPQQATRCGILIYTATAGSLGTLGGLVATTRRFASILAAALRRLQICSNDPVCADHHPARRTDDRALHGAACHGCLLIAETSARCAMYFSIVRSSSTPWVSRARAYFKSAAIGDPKFELLEGISWIEAVAA